MDKKWIFLIFLSFILVPSFAKAQDFNHFLAPSIPGRVEGKGKIFEMKDSTYLNVTLESEKEIEVVFESIPRMISLNIASSNEAVTILTIKGLEPNKKYFKYEDTHKNETEFFSGEKGSYSWEQDLTLPHYIWIQEIKGTIYISGPEDCVSPIGIWDETFRTCTLVQDVTTSIEIATSSITLDCNSYRVSGQNTGHGVYLRDKTDINIKHCLIENFSTGIFLSLAENVVVENNEISNNWYGIDLENSQKIQIKNNTLFDHLPRYNTYGATAIVISGSSLSTIYQNRIFHNEIGIFMALSSSNLIEENDFQNLSYNLEIYSSSTQNLIKNNSFKNASQINLLLFGSNDNEITLNDFDQGGGHIAIDDSNNNLLTKNTFKNAYRVISFSSSYGKGVTQNKIYLNNFIDNTFNFLKEKKDVIKDNFWNSPQPLTYSFQSKTYTNYLGNFWSNYQGKDEDGDGIGDTPYVINSEKDDYPLIKPWENYLFPSLPHLLISEVYYDVAEDKGEERDNEWIIIHNLENEPIDISEWQICDNERCDKIPTSSIPANGFAIITPTSTTFNYWKIPNDMVKVVLGSKFGGQGLANNGDRVILKDKDGNLIDAMSYGNDKSIFDTPPKAREGYSLLRYPPDRDTDTGEDFIETEPTISNKPPIPIFNFFPKNPVKGVKVKFDASFSDDPDGEIVKFEWQIASTTLSGTTTEFVFNENGEYEITLIVTDNDGATSSTSTTIKVESFSFAIITDLHIGRHYQEEYEGQEYYLTQRLRNVVKWINENKDEIKCGENETCPIKFIAILGDITENTPLAGFCKAKEILDELEIPYVPVFGNHDVGTDKEYEQCSKWKGQDYFDEVFWSMNPPCENASSSKNFELLLKELNFQRDGLHKDYKNFSFSFGGINFIGLDFNSREHFMKIGPGVGSDAVLNRTNKEWLEKKLEEFKGEPIILLAHHPLIFDPINAFSFTEFPQLENLIKNNNMLFFDFGGHIHSFEEWHGKGLWIANANKKYAPIGYTTVLTSEALMVGSNGRGAEKQIKEDEKVINGVVNGKKGIVRIVKVFDKNNLNPYNWETTEKEDEFLALNPSLNLGLSIRKQFMNIPCVELEAHKFSEKPSYFVWEFGGEISSLDCNSDFSECLVCYKDAGEYTITLFAKDKNSSFTEWISKKITVNESVIPRTIKKSLELIKKGIEFISEKTRMSFDKIGQVIKDKVHIFKKESPSVPIGEITVHFENLNEDLDLSTLVVDTDIEKRKAILHMENWPNEVERSKVLFLPNNGK